MKSDKDRFTAVYIRTSKTDGRQATGEDSQRRALNRYCRLHRLAPVKLYVDRISGATTKRPKLDLLQKRVFEGRVVTIVVWACDRITRCGILDGLTTLHGWLSKGVRFVSLSEQFDFEGANGELAASIYFHIARQLRENLIASTRRGLEAARARGQRLGPPVKLHAEGIVPLLKQGMTVTAAAAQLGCTPQGAYAALRREGVSLQEARGQQPKQ
jgi:DNA invertase Pin-like site-specific DNA recombinase